MTERYAFIVSDRTGITAETMGHMLLSQFPHLQFKTVPLPFVDTDDKAEDAVRRINMTAAAGGPPLIFATLVDDKIRETISRSNGVFFDLFNQFLGPLERALGSESSHTVGRSHGVVDPLKYTSRIAAVNFSLRTDDGVHVADYGQASLIIVGVSRTGKTPTCLYLALHFGTFAANYPLTVKDLDAGHLPRHIGNYRHKVYGLTIEPERLMQIRQERFAKGSYAQLNQCRYEVAQAEALFRRDKIPHLNTTSKSVEEIATTILYRAKLKRDLL